MTSDNGPSVPLSSQSDGARQEVDRMWTQIRSVLSGLDDVTIALLEDAGLHRCGVRCWQVGGDAACIYLPEDR
jgi:hypothetical protein